MKYFFFFFITTYFLVNAQTDSIIINDFHDALRVGADYYTAPLRYDSKDWITFSSVIGITALSSLADKEIQGFSQRNQSPFAEVVFSIDKYYYFEFVAASLVGFYGYGLLADNNKIRKLSVKLAEATLLSTSITLFTKTIIGRGRPYKQESQYSFNPFTFDNDYNSLPSGHTTLAFAYSTVMANEIDNVFWKIGWYSLAGLVGYARIYHNQHWFSDVFLGAAVGYFSGEFVNNHNRNMDSRDVVINLYPIPMGFAVQIVF